ncbi:hypothetical protein D9M69_554950 [compost metagenome]
MIKSASAAGAFAAYRYTALLLLFQVSAMVSVSLEGALRKQAHQPLFSGVSSAVYSLLSADRVLENDMLDTGFGF